MHFLKQLSNLLVIVAIAMHASCASQKKVTMRKAKAESGLDKFNSNYDYEKDESGLMRAVSDDKSQYSRKQGFTGTKDVQGKDYNKVGYRKKRWGQKTEYGKSQFQGKKDSNYGDSPYYVQQARMNQQKSRFEGSKYGTSGYATSNANVATGNNRNSNYAGRTSGYVTSRENYAEPLIMSKQQYSKISQGKMSVKQTNSMLGR